MGCHCYCQAYPLQHNAHHASGSKPCGGCEQHGQGKRSGCVGQRARALKGVIEYVICCHHIDNVHSQLPNIHTRKAHMQNTHPTPPPSRTNSLHTARAIVLLCMHPHAPMLLCMPGYTSVANNPDTAPAPRATLTTASDSPRYFRYAVLSSPKDSTVQ